METGPNGAGRIAFLGFGEAAQAFLKGWRSRPDFAARIVAYDVKTDSPEPRVRDAKRGDYAAACVEGGESAPASAAAAAAACGPLSNSGERCRRGWTGDMTATST